MRIPAAIRPAEMGEDDHLRPTRRQRVQRRQQPLDARCVADAAAGQRYVEIGAYNDAFARHIHIVDTFITLIGNDRRHRCFPILFKLVKDDFGLAQGERRMFGKLP